VIRRRQLAVRSSSWEDFVRQLVRWLTATLFLLPAMAFAQTGELIVEKKTFELPTYTTVAGATIKNVRIGWESAGALNGDKSNAILITHFFSGTSHAFGKYAPGDAAPGYWDAIIGPGKAIDTNKYFVLSSDTLVNLNVNAPNVVTTGPASIDPDTGKPYGMRFPVVSIKDFVNVQKALIDSLGIRKLHAVAGASMGGFQAYEWAASYPDMVDRVMPVISTPAADPFLIGWLDIWGQPIRLDPKWNGGDYYGREPPLAGLSSALKVVTLQANQWEWAAKTFGLEPADASKDPAKAMDNTFKIQAFLESAGAARAKSSDANHFLYLVKANQLANADASKIKMPVLLLYSPTDLVFQAPLVEAAAKQIANAGATIETGKLVGPYGHQNASLATAQATDQIRAFMDK
jgi:homoserine O-acetyltransferase